MVVEHMIRIRLYSHIYLYILHSTLYTYEPRISLGAGRIRTIFSKEAEPASKAGVSLFYRENQNPNQNQRKEMMIWSHGEIQVENLESRIQNLDRRCTQYNIQIFIIKDTANVVHTDKYKSLPTVTINLIVLPFLPSPTPFPHLFSFTATTTATSK